MSKYLLILICIFFLATRIYKISEVPPSLYWDEASIGYNAYSIAQTGRDEWGKFLPIHFRAFGEFKLPVYIYSDVPFVKIFGLNEFSVRIPAVLFSLGVIVITFFLAKKVTGSASAGLWSSFFITISPWFFIFSRTGFEATAGLMFYILGIYFFLNCLKNYFIFFSVLSFILSIYSYNSFRIISSITLIFFFLILFRKKNTGRTIVISLVSILFFLLSLVPIIRLYIYDAGFGRTQAFTLFPSVQQVYDLSGKPHFQLIFDRSKSTDWGNNINLIFRNYISHFSPSFLIFDGDSNPRNQQPGFGQIYILDLFLFVFGILYIRSLKKKWMYGIVLLLLLGILPASLFKESPHALRSIGAVPLLLLIISFGAVYISAKNVKLVYILTSVYTVLFITYFQHFVVNYAKDTSKDWQYGYKSLFLGYKDKFKNYDKVIISDEYGQPYIFALFYLKYDPNLYLSSVKYNPVQDWGFSKVGKFHNFEFQKENNLNIRNNGKTLLFTVKNNNLSKKPTSVIKLLDGSIAFWVYEI